MVVSICKRGSEPLPREPPGGPGSYIASDVRRSNQTIGVNLHPVEYRDMVILYCEVVSWHHFISCHGMHALSFDDSSRLYSMHAATNSYSDDK